MGVGWALHEGKHGHKISEAASNIDNRMLETISLLQESINPLGKKKDVKDPKIKNLKPFSKTKRPHCPKR